MQTSARSFARPAAAGVQMYWRVSGVALATAASVGILLVAIGKPDLIGFLAFDTAHNVTHVVLAAAAIALGFGEPDARLAKHAAKAAGALYVLLAILGFLSASLFGAGDLVGLRLEVGEGVLHLLLGAWGLYAGFAR